ncbi:putative N-lysine methyltransferase SETD8-B [Apostichopus japonicus]|uniref:Putative N-lysine methyltransferase SETD8-B n=1 Tax=Stichopus japonicus TaxID=307972 RepID=A0A2G8LA85_STIJA|nr:putative N-lysine methyltransferase SETD8-B [Apostichopus japonicus]
MQMMDDQEGFLVKILPIKGRAIFTQKKIEKGDFLLTYKGELVNATEGDKRDAIKETGFRFFFRWKHQKLWSIVHRPSQAMYHSEAVCLVLNRTCISHWQGIKKSPCACVNSNTQIVDASEEPRDDDPWKFGRLVNHARSRKEINSKVKVFEGPDNKPQLQLFATRHIPADEEILYDYGLPFSYCFPPPAFFRVPEEIPQKENENFESDSTYAPESDHSDSQLSQVIPLPCPFSRTCRGVTQETSPIHEDGFPVEEEVNLQLSPAVVPEPCNSDSQLSEVIPLQHPYRHDSDAGNGDLSDLTATETNKKSQRQAKRKLKVYEKRKLLVNGIMDKEDSDDDTVNMNTNIHQKKDVLKKKYSSSEDKEFTTTGGVQLGEVPESCNLDSQMSEVVSLACPFSNICHGVTQDTSPFHANEFPIEGEVDLQLSPAEVPESWNSDSQLSEVIPLQHPYCQDSDAGNGDLSDLEEDHDPEYSVESLISMIQMLLQMTLQILPHRS